MSILLVLLRCSKIPKNANEVVSDEQKKSIDNVVLLSFEKGTKQLQMHCFSCHNPKSASHDDMLAPPLAGIKYKYKQRYKRRTEFISKMSDFVFKPCKENALMKGPVRRFGLMLKTSLMTKDKVYQVVAYIYI